MLAIFLDLETTGLDPSQHVAIDIALVCVNICHSRICASYQSLIAIDSSAWQRADARSLAINGYSWDRVCQGKLPSVVADEVTALLQTQGVVRGQAAFICQNPSFDRAFFSQLISVYRQEELQWPYHWLDLASMYWTLVAQQCQQQNQLFPTTLSLSKNAIASHYGLPQEPDPHTAINGVNHLVQLYQTLLQVSFR